MFHLSIQTKRNTLLKMIKWLEGNISQDDKTVIKFRRESRLVARRFKRSPRPYLFITLYKEDYLSFKNIWLLSK